MLSTNDVQGTSQSCVTTATHEIVKMHRESWYFKVEE